MSLRGRLALLVGALLILFGIGSTAFAQTSSTGGSGLSISPTRFDLTIDKGQQSTIQLTLKNISGTDIVAKSAINDFESNGVSGEPRIITDPTKQSSASIRNFLVGVTDLPLAKDESKTITVQVSVPQNAAPGAYYGIIRYAAVRNGQTSGGSNQVSLTASVGAVVLVTVPGNITQQVKLVSIQAFKNITDNTSSSFFLSAPKAIGIELQNLGNGFSSPFGRVSIKDMFGKEVFNYELNSGDPRGVILPNSSRLFKDSVKGISMPGRYTITGNISYGSGGDILISTGTFWYLPVWLIVVLVILLVVLIGLGYVLYRRLRRPVHKHAK